MRENYNNWVWFALKNDDELYSVISTMIEDKVKELLPQMVEEQLRQKVDNLSFNIQTTLNGKTSNTLKQDIIDIIVKELS